MRASNGLRQRLVGLHIPRVGSGQPKSQGPKQGKNVCQTFLLHNFVSFSRHFYFPAERPSAQAVVTYIHVLLIGL